MPLDSKVKTDPRPRHRAAPYRSRQTRRRCSISCRQPAGSSALVTCPSRRISHEVERVLRTSQTERPALQGGAAPPSGRFRSCATARIGPDRDDPLVAIGVVQSVSTRIVKALAREPRALPLDASRSHGEVVIAWHQQRASRRRRPHCSSCACWRDAVQLTPRRGPRIVSAACAICKA